MAGVRISALPAIAVPALTDLYPVVQSGVTYKETGTQLAALVLAQPLGAASATSIAFSSTTGIIGTTTNDSAAAGSVGQFISSNIVAGSAVALTSTVTATIAEISLTAGDWDTWAVAATNPASGTVTTNFNAAISLIAATLPTLSPETPIAAITNVTGSANEYINMTVGPGRISLATTTTVYLVMNCSFADSTMGGYGFIAARRVR